MTVAWHAAERAHAVQFYEGEPFLHHAIAAFFGEARMGDPLVMIARRETLHAVVAQLASAQDCSPVDVANRITFVDVDVALRQFMDGALPDPVRVEQGFAQLLADAGRAGEGTIRLYGEMVDVLCKEGNYAAAIRLEELWNAREPEVPVVVLCGYRIADFDDDVNASQIRRVCQQHTHVMPTDGVLDAPDDQTRFGQVALLEQRARLLDHILERREPSAATVNTIPTVYVVDDDSSVRNSLGRLLASVDWHVQTFESAEAFLAELPDLSSGCLVVDVQLGGISGLELQRRIADTRCTMPVIAMSASPDAKAETEALRMGASVFLRKPFDAQRLIDAIACLMF